MKKNYVVRVNLPSDWPEIHNLLTQDGTLEDNIPSHACECVDEKTTCDNRATYLLDEEEVELLSSHPGIKYIELDPHFHPEAYPEVIACDNRFITNVKNYKATEEGPASLKPPLSNPTSEELNRTGWQLKRLTTKSDPWDGDYTSFSGDEFVNRNYAGNVLSTNVAYSTGEDGSNVDCIVIDNGVWHGHPEFVDEDGVSRVLDVILDGPYYIDKAYFDSNSKTTTFLGRTTCTDLAAREWWSDATKRSTAFSTVGTISGIPSTYTRANVCGDYSSYPAHSSISSEFADHGTGCASTMYGKTFGWAFNSNKWNIAINLGYVTASGISIAKSYEIVRFFVNNKPVNLLDNKKDPTVISNSYGYIDYVADKFETSNTAYYNFRGSETGSFSNKTSAPNFLKNFSSENNLQYSSSTFVSLSQREDGEELVNLDGVYFFAAAGNDNQKQVKPDDVDYNNYWSYQSNPTEFAKYYVNRRGFPADINYNSVTKEYDVFSISALSGYRDSALKENKDWYSNTGSACDIFAPASGTLSAAGNSNQETFPRYDSSSYYTWLNKGAFDTIVSGTSTACPVAAGFAASKLSKLRTWDKTRLKKYFKYFLESQSIANFNIGSTDISTANSSEWVSYANLHGQDPKILYNTGVPSLSFSANLNAQYVTYINNEINLSVTPLNNYANSYTYQWEVKRVGQSSFSPILGATNNSYSEVVDLTNSNDEFRCLVDSDGPYVPTYSSVASIVVIIPYISITTQPESKNVDFASSVLISVIATTNSPNLLTYQWQKSINSGATWTSLPGATNNSLNFNFVSSSSVGLYRCIISDGISTNSPLISEAAQLTVNLPVLSFTIVPESIKTYKGDNVSLQVEAKSSYPSSVFYQWQKSSDGISWSNLTGQTSKVLELPNIKTSSEGYYRCLASDGISSNSPLLSPPIKLDVFDVLISLDSQPAVNISVVEGEELNIELSATLSDGRKPAFTWQKKLTSGAWELFKTTETGSLYLESALLSYAGTYRCVISDSLAENSPIISNNIKVDIDQSFTVNGISVFPAISTIFEKTKLSVDIDINNPALNYKYQWQRKESGQDTWVDITGAKNSNYEFELLGSDYLDSFRCQVNNLIGNEQISEPIVLEINPFIYILTQPDSRIRFYQNSDSEFNLYPEIISSSPELLNYSWEISKNGFASWEQIEGEIYQVLNLTPEKILLLGSEDYYVRCKIYFGENSVSPLGLIGGYEYTNIVNNASNALYTSPTLIDLKSKINLFGDKKCLNEDQARELNEIDINVEPITTNDSCKDKNSCGISIEELLIRYEFYNTQKGIYKSWGDIIFPWEISNLTPNLLINETDDRWKVAKYKESISYFIGDRVLLIEDDGYELSLYEAIEDIPSITGPFKPSKWNKVCSVKTTIPVGLPTVEELLERYEFFALDMFLEEWGNFNSNWKEALYDSIVQQCRSTASTLEELEKCIKTTSEKSSDDRWEYAKLKKENFYEIGDYVLVEGPCGDSLCLYICIENIPTTERNFELHKVFSPVTDGVKYWDKIYCVNTGKNKCLEPQRKRDLPNYQLVQLGSQGHYVEQPIPFYDLEGKKLCGCEFKTLNEAVEYTPPRVLTQEEIDALE